MYGSIAFEEKYISRYSIRFQEKDKSKYQGKSLGEEFSRIYTDIQSIYEYIRVYALLK